MTSRKMSFENCTGKLDIDPGVWRWWWSQRPCLWFGPLSNKAWCFHPRLAIRIRAQTCGGRIAVKSEPPNHLSAQLKGMSLQILFKKGNLFITSTAIIGAIERLRIFGIDSTLSVPNTITHDKLGWADERQHQEPIPHFFPTWVLSHEPGCFFLYSSWCSQSPKEWEDEWLWIMKKAVFALVVTDLLLGDRNEMLWPPITQHCAELTNVKHRLLLMVNLQVCHSDWLLSCCH